MSGTKTGELNGPWTVVSKLANVAILVAVPLIGWMLLSIVDLQRFQSATTANRWTVQDHAAYADDVEIRIDEKADADEVPGGLARRVDEMALDIKAVKSTQATMASDIAVIRAAVNDP